MRPIQLKEFVLIQGWWNKRKESDLAWKVNLKTIIECGCDLDIKNPTRLEEEKEYNCAELIEILNASLEKGYQLVNQVKQGLK